MSRKATQIFEKMKRNKSGWHSHHFHTLYLGFGLTIRAGRKHDIFIHPDYPQLRDTIPRHAKELSPAYARDAVKNIKLLQELSEEEDEANE